MPRISITRTKYSRTRATLASVEASASEVLVLAPEDMWLRNFNLTEFGSDVRALGVEIAANQGEADVSHLRKMRRWASGVAMAGLGTMALPLNPVAPICLALWIHMRWTMVAHHTCHGGYQKVGEADVGRFKAKTFALGGAAARLRDWLDWMLPEAWNVEHNVLHHYNLSEESDPDLVERNLEFVRRWRGPLAFKYAFIALMAGVWKWAYYAPNTYKQLKVQECARDGKSLPEGFDPNAALTVVGALLLPEKRGGLFSPAEFLGRVLLPVVALRFAALSLPLLLVPHVGATLAARAALHLAAADVLTNILGFLTIVTNHCGADLYRFDRPAVPNSAEFALRQVLASANYRTGGGRLGGRGTGNRADLVDAFHGWLNYQVEHHLWPTLSMLSYQRAQPRLEAICAKHGVLYIQESVWVRLRKTLDVMVGRASMRRFPHHALRS